MGEWPKRPLGELVQNFDGRRIPVKEADRRPGPYPYHGASGVVDHVDEYLFDGEYLLVAEDGENLRTRKTPVAFLVSGRFWVNNHVHIVQANEASDTRYLAYALSVSDLAGYLTGSTMPKLTQGNLHRIPVIAPPLAEQRRIAEILGALDDKIELNRRMGETLEATGRALFKSWFVDFDSDRAESRLDSRVGSLLDVADLLSGGTPRTDQAEYWGGDIRWASAKDISQCSGPFLVDTERHITPRGLAESPTQMIPALSSVVVARGATTGRLAMLGESMAMNQTCYALTSRGSAPFWLYLQLRQVMGHLVHSAHGSVFDTITTRTFASAMFPLPPESRRRAFDELVAPLLRRVLGCSREIRTLSEIRDALLPRLISGELRPADAERAVEAMSA